MIEAIVASIVIGGALEAYSADSAAKRKSKSILEASERQAKAYESTAADTLQAGSYEAGVASLKAANVMGDARLAIAGSNLDGGEDALRKTAYMAELDVNMIKMNARRAAWGLQAQARETRLAGEDAAAAVREEGRARVMKSIIGSGSQGAMAYAKYA